MESPESWPDTPEADGDGASAPPFPVAYSLLSPEALLAEVGRAYTIAPPVDCTLLRSYVNDVYAVATTAGDYILKVYRARWRSRSEIAYELDVLAHLTARGVAVAPPIPRRDGRLIGALRAPEGVRYAVLFAHAAGAKPARPFTTTLYRHFGRTTARLHAALDDFASPHARVPLDLAYFLDRPLAALRPRLADRPDDWAFLVGLAEKVRARVTALAAAGLDWGVCHGDLSLDNLHVTPEGRITFYDFDSGGPGWRASDPYGVLLSAILNGDDYWEAFLVGYTEVRPFGPADLAAVPYFAAAYGIQEMGGRVSDWAAWSGRWMATEAYFDDALAQWRRWDAEQLGDEPTEGR